LIHGGLKPTPRAINVRSSYPTGLLSILILRLWQKKCVYVKLKDFLWLVGFFSPVRSKQLITLVVILVLQLWVWDWFTESNALDKLFGRSVRPIYNQLLQTVETSASHPLPFIPRYKQFCLKWKKL